MTPGSELVDNACDAPVRAESRPPPETIRIPHPLDVAAIRGALALSQSDFASRFGLAVATVRDWEQGRRIPDRAARVLLGVIRQEPETVARIVAAG